MTNKSKQSLGFIWGTLAGVFVGATSALLLAPKPGKELRRDLFGSVQQLNEQAARTAGQAREATGKAIKQVSEQSSLLADRARQVTSQAISDVKSWRILSGVAGGQQAQAIEEEQVADLSENMAEGLSEDPV